MMRAKGFEWLGALLLLTLTTAASAQTYSCSTSSGGTLNFMTYDLAVATTASATVTLTCQHLSGGAVTVSWVMQLSNGSSGSCLGPTGRAMRRAPTLDPPLGYNVYKNATPDIWGNTGCSTPLSGTFPNLSNGQPNASTIQTLRGVIPPGQQVPSGTYSETLQLTISF